MQIQRHWFPRGVSLGGEETLRMRHPPSIRGHLRHGPPRVPPAVRPPAASFKQRQGAGDGFHRHEEIAIVHRPQPRVGVGMHGEGRTFQEHHRRPQLVPQVEDQRRDGGKEALVSHPRMAVQAFHPSQPRVRSRPDVNQVTMEERQQTV